jgi:hypothetical protein
MSNDYSNVVINLSDFGLSVPTGTKKEELSFVVSNWKGEIEIVDSEEMEKRNKKAIATAFGVIGASIALPFAMAAGEHLINKLRLRKLAKRYQEAKAEVEASMEQTNGKTTIEGQTE